MHQATQHSKLNDVLTIIALQTCLEIERKARAADIDRVRKAEDQLRAITQRATV